MRRTPGFWLALAATAAVVAAIVAGLFAIPSPGTARLERLDRERMDDLRAIERELDSRQARGLPPPASLDQFEQLPPDVRTDPATDEPYSYRVLSDSTAEVCATFALASDQEERVAPVWSEVGAHEAGRHCFVLHPDRNR